MMLLPNLPHSIFLSVNGLSLSKAVNPLKGGAFSAYGFIQTPPPSFQQAFSLRPRTAVSRTISQQDSLLPTNTHLVPSDFYVPVKASSSLIIFVKGFNGRVKTGDLVP